MKSNQPTMKDVAREARVALGTVSKVFNGIPVGSSYKIKKETAVASEYLKWLARNEKPEEPRVLSKKEKWKNWWYYHKWHVVIGVLLLAILGSIVWNALTQTEPDYQVAYVGANILPNDTVTALEACLAALTVDGTQLVTCNGQTFTVLTYTFDSETNPYAKGASAFGVYRNYAISIELSCREGFSGDPLEVLADFLEHCHYST